MRDGQSEVPGGLNLQGPTSGHGTLSGTYPVSGPNIWTRYSIWYSIWYLGPTSGSGPIWLLYPVSGELAILASGPLLFWCYLAGSIRYWLSTCYRSCSGRERWYCVDYTGMRFCQAGHLV